MSIETVNHDSKLVARFGLAVLRDGGKRMSSPTLRLSITGVAIDLRDFFTGEFGTELGELRG